MANTTSARKAARKIARRTEINKARRSRMRGALRKVEEAIASGDRNKALEAMASGKAIVATPEAVAGLRVVNDEHLLVASDPRSFAEAVIEVIRDENLRLRLGNRARVFVETEHDWKPVLQKLTQLVEAVGSREAQSGKTNIRAIANR